MYRLPRRKLRWWILLYGVIVFLWLSPEDDHVLPVVLLGLSGSALLVVSWLIDKFGGQLFATRETLFITIGAGGVIGGGTSAITAALMLFKNARHAHLFPDYPALMIGAILERAPIWGLAGALVGLSIGLVWLALGQVQSPDTTESPETPPLESETRQ